MDAVVLDVHALSNALSTITTRFLKVSASSSLRGYVTYFHDSCKRL